MNLSKLGIANIRRIIAHDIHPKTETKDAFATTRNQILEFSAAEKSILSTRIVEAITNTTKTFQLDYEDRGDTSIYKFLKDYKTVTEKEFVTQSISLAHNLAYAHFRTKIPGGYCLIGDGQTTDKKNFFFIIKAELQEVFNIQKNKLRIIKDVFLSPAKDFYKIGFFVESGTNYIPFMYDDQFSLQKKDLTEYFYSQFLGLTTDKNDILKSKNFYDDTKYFVEHNISNIQDRIGILKALTVLYREDSSGIISPKEFSDKYFEGDLRSQFEKKIIEQKFPHSFTKDISIMEHKLELQRISIPLSYNLSIVGNASDLSDVSIVEDPSRETLKQIEPEINNGRITKLVLLRQHG